MSSVNVICGYGEHTVIENYSIECPYCHSIMNPVYLFVHNRALFAMCSNSDCGHHFVLTKNSIGQFKVVQPNARPAQKTFSDIIVEVSPNFIEIYNQAFCAEQLCLDQICGTGYRKALEFLIKDYLIMGIQEESQKESIKKKLLGQCIQEDVENVRVKEIARRAAWLGNDETHYVRAWEEKDVNVLKQLIELAVHWIEDEIASNRLLAEMPEPRK